MKISKKAKREAKQLYRFCMVDGRLDENRVRQVVQRVIAAGERDGSAILAHFLRLVKLDCARHTATIESAAPLPADLQAVIQAGLTRRYGPGLTMAFSQRPALIGGMRVQVGCDVYDGSVRAGLEALEKRFLNRGNYGRTYSKKLKRKSRARRRRRRSKTSASSARLATASPRSKA